MTTRPELQSSDTTPGPAELRLLDNVTAAEAAGRSGLAGDGLEMKRVAADHGALEGDRVLLSRLPRRAGGELSVAPVVVSDASLPPGIGSTTAS